MPYARTFSKVFRGFSTLMFVLAFCSLLAIVVFDQTHYYYTIPTLLFAGVAYRIIARYLGKFNTPNTPGPEIQDHP